MNIIDKLYCYLINKYEEFTHWYWNRKPHYVICRICGETIRSDEKYFRDGSSPSPEERGWRELKGGGWICHQCYAHRDYTPYIDLVDLDENIMWCKDEEGILTDQRDQLLEKLKGNHDIGDGEIYKKDAENVAHWIALTECANEGVYCSHCHKKVYKLDYSNTMRVRSKFCPNCGFKMLPKVEEL